MKERGWRQGGGWLWSLLLLEGDGLTGEMKLHVAAEVRATLESSSSYFSFNRINQAARRFQHGFVLLKFQLTTRCRHAPDRALLENDSYGEWTLVAID